MPHIPEEIFERIVGYIKNNRDRNAASLVCKSWYKFDKYTRHRVLIGNCYALSPDRLIGRFPAVRSLTIKGEPSLGYANWIPRNWGGSVHPWVLVLANTCPDLEELHLAGMVVLDQTLVLISTAFPNFKSLELVSCRGFTGNGLAAIAANCRILEHLDLATCKAENDDGHWLSCFPESFTSLVTLNFSRLSGAVNLVDLERLVARCPNLKNLELSNLVPVTTISRIAMLAPQLLQLAILPKSLGPDVDPQPVELGIAPHVAPQLAYLGIQHTQFYTTLFKALRTWNSLHSLSVSATPLTLLFELPISPICSTLTSLDMCSFPLGLNSGFEKIIKCCRRLKCLWILDSIGDKGLLAVSSTCNDLRDLRLFPSYPTRRNRSVTEEGLIAISEGCPLLDNLQFVCDKMTDDALITLSMNCPNIKSFMLSIPESKEPDRVALQPLDEGFGAIVQSFKALRQLYISGPLTDLVFLYIGLYAERLEVLSANYAGDSDKGMLHVLKGCRNLRRLEFNNCPFGDTALLANVGRYETLQCLCMSGCEVTLGGCKALANQVLSLNVEVINEPDEVGDCAEDSLKVKKMYAYHILDGTRNDAPDNVWIF